MSAGGKVGHTDASSACSAYCRSAFPSRRNPKRSYKYWGSKYQAFMHPDPPCSWLMCRLLGERSLFAVLETYCCTIARSWGPSPLWIRFLPFLGPQWVPLSLPGASSEGSSSFFWATVAKALRQTSTGTALRAFSSWIKIRFGRNGARETMGISGFAHPLQTLGQGGRIQTFLFRISPRMGRRSLA